MHRTRACCRSSTVSAQKRYSLIASPGHSSTSVEGMSSRARRRALGSAWMSEMIPIFIFLSFLLCSGFHVAKQEALSLTAYGLGIWLMAYSLWFMAYRNGEHQWLMSIPFAVGARRIKWTTLLRRVIS